MLAAAGEQQGGDAVDDDPDRATIMTVAPVGRRGMEQPADRFGADRADRDQQEQGD